MPSHEDPDHDRAEQCPLDDVVRRPVPGLDALADEPDAGAGDRASEVDLLPASLSLGDDREAS